ncbi:hypothetical protein SAMD00019534_019430 [Acytostelium subglobosum LB1]|uniref:hypothetical protein n=1 Tax=Acytostelium subglobosum LB1 TaxID=1410327 RepID=UPI000644ED4D|nr:hypothetical protein SAMD00019534_019430 [Acytostelium subglobosum LB1]GAM18768.1 hypothetical protein SAMD00019534_019430 [Acytostelium subglobosum LB1]|eukprot:XP_012757988.1 hypothetical protein SAMD00019534_019430 [Acytostelium subglobosum LB1]
MGNLFSSCCDKKQHTPYDPFIYDEDYEEYHSPNVLNPNLINTYDPPPPILMDQYSSGTMSNRDSYTSHDIRDSYYEDQQIPHRQSIDNTYTISNKYSNIENYDANSYQPFSETFDDSNNNNSDVQDDQVTFEAEHRHPNLNNVTETLNHSIHNHQQQQTPQPWQTQTKQNTNNNNNNSSSTLSTGSTGSGKQSLQHSANAQDKFYPRYMNFTESVYMAQPPSTELGITDSIVDSIVLGLDNRPPKEQHFNAQHMQQQQQHNNVYSPQQRQQQQQQQQQQHNNIDSSILSESSSSPMTDSNFGSSSIYYDTQNSFTR